MRPYLPWSFGFSAAFLLAIGCGSSESTGGSTGTGGSGSNSSTGSTGSSSSTGSTGSSSSSGSGSDPSHPPGNGMHISEATACDLLSSAQGMQRLTLKCTGTSRTCPDLLRSVFMTECLEYDQGSVQGCISQYFAAKTCDELLKAFDECMITSFPGSEPKGCPG
jgi:hypothetical protein